MGVMDGMNGLDGVNGWDEWDATVAHVFVHVSLILGSF
jgi:hypothetical protein